MAAAPKKILLYLACLLAFIVNVLFVEFNFFRRFSPSGSSTTEGNSRVRGVDGSTGVATGSAVCGSRRGRDTGGCAPSALPTSTLVTEEASRVAYESVSSPRAATGREWMKHVTFMVLGVQKGGTSALFFHVRQNRYYAPALSGKGTAIKEIGCLAGQKFDPSDPACERYYGNLNLEGRNTTHHVFGDFTPSYFPFQESLAANMAAHYPWLKFIVLLRDPSSRAYSEYNMHASRVAGSPKKSIDPGKIAFEDVILKDLRRLKKCGLLPHWNFDERKKEKKVGASALRDVRDWLSVPTDDAVLDSWFGSSQMSEAWSRYTAKGFQTRNSYLGQGLYAVILHRWMTVFPSDRFLILKQSAMARDTQSECNRVFDFLQIPRTTVKIRSGESKRVGNATKEETEQLLHKVFEPFNALLPRLLGG